MSELLPTYYDIKYSHSSKIFEAELVEKLTPDQLQEAEKNYKLILEKLQNGENIDEGLLGAVFGAAGGAIAASTLGKALAAALGLNENGALYKLITSKIVLASIGAYLGYKI